MSLSIQDKKIIENKYRTLLRICSDYNKEDKKFISQAFKLAYDAHKNVKRKSGEPYIIHPLSVSIICAREIGLGKTSIICSLLHDVVEDSKFTIEDIEMILRKEGRKEIGKHNGQKPNKIRKTQYSFYFIFIKLFRCINFERNSHGSSIF